MKSRLFLAFLALSALVIPRIAYGQSRVADLALIVTPSPVTAVVGQNLTYHIIVSNHGPGGYAAFSLTAQLQASVELVSVSPSCQHSGSAVSCGPLLLDPFQSAAFLEIVVKPKRVGHIVTSLKLQSVGSFSQDPNPFNNTATVTTQVVESLPPSPNEGFAFLRGFGGGIYPQVLYLDMAAPVVPVAQYKDSTAVRSGLTNPWVEIGTWLGRPLLFTGTLNEIPDLHVWLGLKTSDDEGTQFDLRAEVWKNDVELVASGETACLQGVTRDPDKAMEANLPFDLFSPVEFDGITDALSLKVLARIGTRCSGPNHGSAAGVRLYFGSVLYPSGSWTPVPATPPAP
jgi:uncharacterized repeat protein (TIGR01451 family)